MNRLIKKCLIIILTLAAIVSSCAAITVFAADYTSANWTGFNKTTVGEDTVYALPFGGGKLTFGGSIKQRNSTEFYIDVTSHSAGYFALVIEGKLNYGFRFDVSAGKVYIRNETDNIRYQTANYNFTTNAYNAVRCIYDEALLAVYVNDELVTYCKNFDNENLTKTGVYLYSTGLNGYAKSLSNKAVTAPELPDIEEIGTDDATSAYWNGYDKKVVNDERVYDLPTDEGGRRNVYSGDKNVNTVEADLMVNWAINEFNCGLLVKGDSHEYLLRFLPEMSRFTIIDFAASMQYRSADYAYTYGKELHLKYYFDNEVVAVYVDGELVVFTKRLAGSISKVNGLAFWNWGNTGYVKNLNAYLGEAPTDIPEEVLEDDHAEFWPFAEQGFDIVEESENNYYYTVSAITDGVTYCNSTYENGGSFNTFETELRFTNPNGGNSGLFAGVSFFVGKTDAVAAYLRLNGTFEVSVKGSVVKTVSLAAVNTGKWYDFKVIFDEDYVKVFLDGVERCAYYDTHGLKTERATPAFRTWGVKYSVKNMRVSHSDITYPEGYKHLDLEFSKQASVDAVSAANAELSYSDGKLIATATGTGDIILDMPPIEVAPGHKYSMLTSLRNTVLVRLKNSTSAERVKVSFTTTTNRSYWYEKYFDIEPNSDYNTYFFNVSDLSPTGYLRDLRFRILSSSGSIEIDAITFEREKPIYDYAGEITSCTADPATSVVTIKGKVKQQFAGKTVTVWRSDPRNYNDSLSSPVVSALSTAVSAADGTFTATAPLYPDGEDKTSLLASFFLASVDGVKLSDHFVIENYSDFSEAGERFTIDCKLVANVLDYGAKGDAFTDDTAAIQAAIEAVNAAGGGKVIIPGDTENPYGRRYIVTHIELCSNLEFVIEEGAVLWQSQREDELNKTVPAHIRGYDEVYYGFDVDIDGVIWSCGYNAINKPLIYTSHAEYVRICGGGTIRMSDVGGEYEDQMYFVGDPALAVGQESRVQQVMVCNYFVNHLDIRDLTYMRTSAWHHINVHVEDVFFTNVEEREAVNVTGDGYTFTSGCKDILLERCFTYTSDDALVLNATYVDPRGEGFYPIDGTSGRYGANNIKASHCFLYGGFGVAFLTWGTSAPDSSVADIRNIDIYDCYLGGHKSSGSWPDDPYYGTSSYIYGYTQLEDNNFAPITDVYFHNNTYLKEFNWTILGITPKATNLIVTDDVKGTIYSSGEFLNGNFQRVIHNGPCFEDETEFVSGLTYWSYSGDVGTIKNGTTTVLTADTKEPVTVDNYVGYVKGDGELYQGLYEIFGKYVVEMDVKLVGGSGRLFVRDALTGENVVTKTILESSEYHTLTLNFSLYKAATLYIGVSHEGGEDDVLYIDNAVIRTDNDEDTYSVDGETISEDFDNGLGKFYSVTNGGFATEGGMLTARDDSEYKLMLKNGGDLDTFELKVDIYFASGVTNAGVYLFASDASEWQDLINAYNVQVETEAERPGLYSVSIYLFRQGYLGLMTRHSDLPITGDSITLRVVVKFSTILVFVNGGKEPVVSYEVVAGSYGNVGLRSQYSDSKFDNFYLKTTQYVPEEMYYDVLRSTLIRALDIGPDGYTEESYAALQSEISVAIDTLRHGGSNEAYRLGNERLEAAIAALKIKSEPSSSGDDPDSAEQSAVESNEKPTSSATAVSPEPSGGCGGNVTSGAIVTVLIVFAATLTYIRKKRKNADN